VNSLSVFYEKLRQRWIEGKFVCVGLDTDSTKIPNCATLLATSSQKQGDQILSFNRHIIDATKDYACAFKPNIAFYGDQIPHIEALRETIKYAHIAAPDIPVILDAKRGDIGNTNLGYIKEVFEYFDADAVTISPYLGKEAYTPFLSQKDKGIIVLVKTSNPGSGEFQDLILKSGEPLYLHIARQIAVVWNENQNVAIVVGATYPEELAEVREVAPDLPILIPGIGAQGGELENTVKNGLDKNGHGIIVNSSRGIIFASSGDDFAEAAGAEAKKLNDAINEIRVSLGFS
jgi:orotidine-5'-phosphate decarboxylase